MSYEPKEPGASVGYYSTGENGSIFTLRARLRGSYPMTFMTIFEPTFEQVKRLDRHGTYWRALAACTKLLDPIGWRRVSARQIAEDAGISQISAERALAQLEADRVVLGRGKAGAKERRMSRSLISTSAAHVWAQAQDEAPDPEVIDGRGRG